MNRYVLAILAAGALSTPASATDCGKDYKDFMTNFNRDKLAAMSAEDIADLSRTALRGYDACTAGDERFTAENFFSKLDASAHSRSSDIFRSGAFDPPGVKK